MYTPWTRDDTKFWIASVEHRVEDMIYYKQQALDWCEARGIEDQGFITKCLITTCIWVSHMRQETMSLGEVYDFIGVRDLDSPASMSELENYNDTLEFRPGCGDVDLDDLLNELLKD